MEENVIVNSITDEVPVDPAVDTLTPTDDIIPAPECGCEVCPTTVDDGPKVSVAQFFGTLQESVTIIWKFHLKTRKHHVHIILNDFYNGALDIVDSIIEQYQGINGIIEEPFINILFADGKSEIEYLNELKCFITTNKAILGCNSELDSTMDELLSLIDSTLYKLTSFNEHKIKSFDEFCYENLNESCSYNQFEEKDSDDADNNQDEEEEE